MEREYTLTVSLTGIELRYLREAVIHWAWERHQARLAIADPAYASRPSLSEKTADSLERKVLLASTQAVPDEVLYPEV